MGRHAAGMGVFRAPASYGISPPAGGEGRMRPPFSFFALSKKENGPRPVQKEKTASAFKLSARSTWLSASNRVVQPCGRPSLTRPSPVALCAYLCCPAMWFLVGLSGTAPVSACRDRPPGRSARTTPIGPPQAAGVSVVLDAERLPTQRQRRRGHFLAPLRSGGKERFPIISVV